MMGALKSASRRRYGFVIEDVDTSTFTASGDGTTSVDNTAKTLTISFGTVATSLRGTHTIVVGQRYRVSWELSGSGGGQAGFGSTAGGSQYRPVQAGTVGVTNTFDFTAETTTLHLTFQRPSAGTTTFSSITIAQISEVTWVDTSPAAITAATWTTLSSGVTVNGTTGEITIVASGTNVFARGTVDTVNGKAYRIRFTVGSVAAFCLIGTTAAGTQNKASSVSHSPGSYTYEFIATATLTYFQFQRTVAGTAVISNIALQEIS